MIRYSSAIPIVFSLSIIAIIMITIAYATTNSAFDHTYKKKDNISLIARIELAVESFLHYTRDYAFIAVSFLIKQIEEAVVSKHKDSSTYMITRTDIQVVEDKYYSNKNELITIGSKVTIITIEEDNNNNKEREEGG